MERELFSALVKNMKRGAQAAIIEHDLEEAPISLILGALGFMSGTLIAKLPERERRLAAETFVARFYETTVRQ